MILQLKTTSPQATQELGRRIGKVCEPGDWIGLTGELGAGKTCLVQGLASGLDVDPNLAVTSPTFVIHQIYPGRITLHHLDLYRVGSLVELSEIGYEELIEGGGVYVVEWCERVPEAMPGEGLLLRLEIVDDCTRQIEIREIADHCSKIFQKIKLMV